jgi:adenylylsulfate kinase
MNEKSLTLRKGSGAVVREHRLRSLLKTISWRMIATLTMAGLVYLFTGKFALAAKVGLLEAMLKMVFYYLHERAWGRICWGVTRSRTD